MEHRKADLGDATGRATAPDDAAQFLRELRQLRDDAGLGQAELAARAHYPHDLILAAEAGPGLPDLPVLSAYVRACDAVPEEWEERWRSLTRAPAHSELPTRLAGQSPAADAGARVGSTTPITDADPSAIIAALSRVAEEMAGSKPAVIPAKPTAAVPSVPAVPPTPGPVTPAVPSVSDASDIAAGESRPDTQSSGWDPIRVSSAWPALRDTAASAKAAAVPDGVPATAPWGPAPSVPGAGVSGTAWSSVTAGTAGSTAAPASAGTNSAGTNSTTQAVRRRIVVAAALAVLLCLIVVLLVIFA